MSNIRRLHVCEMLKRLILENPEERIGALMSTLLRRGVFKKDPYDVSDSHFSSELENIVEEYRQIEKEKEEL